MPRLYLTAIVVMILTKSVLASEFEFTSRGSFVTVGGGIAGNGDYFDEIFYDRFGVFNEEIEGSIDHRGALAESFAWQFTDLQSIELEGFGESWASWLDGGNNSGSAFGDSFLELEFSLANDVFVSFSGELTTEGALANAEILLEGPITLEFTEDGRFLWEGVLPAGDYFLGVDAFTFVEAGPGNDELFAIAQYDFLLTIVPAPSSLGVLIAAGLAGGSRRRRRSR